MSTVPSPSRRVLAALLAEQSEASDGADPQTPVGRGLETLMDALIVQDAALSEIDRIEEAVFAAHGFPRVPLPGGAGAAAAYASDPATIDRRAATDLQARRLKTELRRRQAVFAHAAARAGLEAAQVREANAARAVSDAAAAVLLAPLRRPDQLALKLIVLIAAGEQAAETTTFHWWCLRVLIADLDYIAAASPRGTPR